MKQAKKSMRGAGVPFAECEAILGEIGAQYDRVQTITIHEPDVSTEKFEDVRKVGPYHLGNIWIEEAKCSGRLQRRLDDVFEYFRMGVDPSVAKSGLTANGLGTPKADPFAELRRFARDDLKGQERAVIDAVCEAGGELPIAELAIVAGVNWDDPQQGFKAAQRRLNPKLKKRLFRIRRRNNAAILIPIPLASKRS